MKVLVSGDDFGLCPGANQGIIRAFEDGVLRNASLLATGAAFEEAAAYCRENPGLSPGVHLALCDEPPLTGVSAIFPGRRPAGPSLPGRNALFAAILSGTLDLSAVEAEWRAQIRRVLEAGVAANHLDSHQFVHLFPRLFPLSLSLAKEFGIPFVRMVVADPFKRPARPARLAQWALLAGFIRAYAAPRIPSGLPVIPVTGFLYAGGRLSPEILLKSLSRLSREPVVEVLLHPALADREMRETYGHWGYSWEYDVALACSRELSRGLERMGGRPAAFAELLP